MADRKLFIHTEASDNIGGDPYVVFIGYADHAYLLTMAGMADGPDIGHHIEHLRFIVENNDIDWNSVTKIELFCSFHGRQFVTSIFCRPIGI